MSFSTTSLPYSEDSSSEKKSNPHSFRSDLEKKSKDELIELGLQLNQLLVQAFRDQQLLSRFKTKCRELERELRTIKTENKSKCNFGNDINEFEFQVPGELVEQNHQLRNQVMLLERVLRNQDIQSKPRHRCKAVSVHFKSSSDYTTIECSNATSRVDLYPGKPPPWNRVLRPNVVDNAGRLGHTTAPIGMVQVKPCNDVKKQPRPKCLTKAPPKLLPLKPKAPFRPPTSGRIPLYWSAASGGSPPRLGATESKDNEDLGNSASINTEMKQAEGSRSELRMGSIFDFVPDGNNKELLCTLLKDPRLDEWFTRKHVDRAIKKAAACDTRSIPNSLKRPCVLSPAVSQKYLITARCLMKPYGQENGWAGFKTAMCQCSLTKYQISLLLETVPDRDTTQGTRKLEEWEDHVAKVQNLKKDNPTVTLYEEEQFVDFISLFPDLHQRLQCMLIMESFSELMDGLTSNIETLMDAIEVISKSDGLRRFFHVVLAIGNRQNEGTSLGNRKWFYMSTLKRVLGDSIDTRPNSKSILTIIASHLGPVMDTDEFAYLEKASQVMIAQVIQKAAHLNDVFRLLSDQTSSTISENTHLPGSNCLQDEFTVIGRQFIEQHQKRFDELKQDIRRLLQDYDCCVTYLGDPELFLPVDKKVPDERNPSQTRFVQDLFSFLVEVLGAYRSYLRQTEPPKPKSLQKSTLPTVLTPQNESDQPILRTVTGVPSTSITTHSDGLTVDCSVAPISTTPDLRETPFSKQFPASEDQALTRDQDISVPIVDTRMHEVVTVTSPDSPQRINVSTAISHSITGSQFPKYFASDTKSNSALGPCDGEAGTTKRRASMRPALFDDRYDPITQRLSTVVGVLEGIQEMVSDTVTHTEKQKPVSLHRPPLPPGHSHSACPKQYGKGPTLNTKRQKESLRTVAGFLSSREASLGAMSCETTFKSGHLTRSLDNACSNSLLSSNVPVDTGSLLTTSSRSLLNPHRSLLTQDNKSPATLSVLKDFKPHSSSLQVSMFSNSTSLLGQRLAARRLASMKLDPVAEQSHESGEHD